MPSLWFRATSLVFMDEWVGFGIKKVTKVSWVGSVVSPRLTLQATHVTLPLHTNCVLELQLDRACMSFHTNTSLRVKEDELEDADCIFPSSIPWFMGAALIRFLIAQFFFELVYAF